MCHEIHLARHVLHEKMISNVCPVDHCRASEAVYDASEALIISAVSQLGCHYVT
jgi:hypothetical protein